MPESKFIDVRDLRVRYLEAGEGIPLVCIHGGSISAELTWEQVGALADTYHVFALDSRGHGATNNPAGSLSYAEMAEDVAAVIDALALERPLVFGYSDGGQVALELALRHPGKARALVFGGTVDRSTDGYIAGLKSWGMMGPGRVDHARLEAAWGDHYRSLPAAHDHGNGPDRWKTLLNQLSELWHTVPTYEPARLRTIAEPTLVICGDRDEVGATDSAPRLMAALPRAELSVIPNCDHAAVVSPLFWAAVRDFLARHA